MPYHGVVGAEENPTLERTVQVRQERRGKILGLPTGDVEKDSGIPHRDCDRDVHPRPAKVGHYHLQVGKLLPHLVEQFGVAVPDLAVPEGRRAGVEEYRKLLLFAESVERIHLLPVVQINGVRAVVDFQTPDSQLPYRSLQLLQGLGRGVGVDPGEGEKPPLPLRGHLRQVIVSNRVVLEARVPSGVSILAEDNGLLDPAFVHLLKKLPDCFWEKGRVEIEEPAGFHDGTILQNERPCPGMDVDVYRQPSPNVPETGLKFSTSDSPPER